MIKYYSDNHCDIIEMCKIKSSPCFSVFNGTPHNDKTDISRMSNCDMKMELNIEQEEKCNNFLAGRAMTFFYFAHLYGLPTERGGKV